MSDAWNPESVARELAPRLARLIALLRGDAAAAGASRPQLSVLGALVRSGPCRITDLAAVEQVAQPTMTTLVARMERSGWLQRSPDAHDRRAVRIAITDSGREAYATGLRHYSESLAVRMRRAGPAEWAALAAALPALDLLISEEERSE